MGVSGGVFEEHEEAEWHDRVALGQVSPHEELINYGGKLGCSH